MSAKKTDLSKFKKATKKIVSVSLDSEVVEKLKKEKINMSKLVNEYLKSLVNKK